MHPVSSSAWVNLFGHHALAIARNREPLEERDHDNFSASLPARSAMDLRHG
jgi:hypothetical protein